MKFLARRGGGCAAATIFFVLSFSCSCVIGTPIDKAAELADSHGDDQGEALKSKIDCMVQRRLQELNVPGYCLTIVSGGKVFFQKGYGFSNQKSSTPVTPDTVFGLASITKTFTALCLLALAQEGKIKLDDTIGKYLSTIPSSWKRITIRQLASMSAGLPASRASEKAWTEEFNLVKQAGLACEPGTRCLYSNPGYRILGTIIEHVTGKTYFEALQERICKPLGMRHTGTQVSLNGSAVVATPYVPGPNKTIITRYRSPEVGFASGSLFASSSDLVRYSSGLLEGKILSREGMQTLWYSRPPLASGAPCPWAFGWGSQKSARAFGNRQLIAMNGSLPGMAPTILIFPASETVVIGLSNMRKPAVYEITRTAARLYFGVSAKSIDDTGIARSGAW